MGAKQFNERAWQLYKHRNFEKYFLIKVLVLAINNISHTKKSQLPKEPTLLKRHYTVTRLRTLHVGSSIYINQAKLDDED